MIFYLFFEIIASMLVRSYCLKIRQHYESGMFSETDDYIRRALIKIVLFKNQ